MQVHFSMEQLPEISFPVLTMGSFDGVHAGHRVIIARLNALARQAGGSSVLITFHPHPRKVLYPETFCEGLPGGEAACPHHRGWLQSLFRAR